MTAIDFSAFVDELATVSGETILPFFRTALSVTDKGNGSFDPVTAADHAAETAMRALIRRTFPEHGIVGEEFGAGPRRRRICLGARPDRRHQVLHLGHAGLGHADRADALRRAGVRHDEPALHPRALQRRRRRRSYRGPAGDRDLRVRACATLAEAVLFTTSPLLMNEADREAFGKVEAAVRLSRYGGDCYAYCMLAAGHVDLVIETELKPYDVIPLVPIITGAGGIITTWENGPPVTGGRIVAAGDKRVHAAALELLKGAS